MSNAHRLTALGFRPSNRMPSPSSVRTLYPGAHGDDRQADSVSGIAARGLWSL